jgi:hypothetical protein
MAISTTLHSTSVLSTIVANCAISSSDDGSPVSGFSIPFVFRKYVATFSIKAVMTLETKPKRQP